MGVTTWARAAPARTAGDAATGGGAVARRATALVAAVFCLLVISDAGYGVADGGPGEAPFVVALVVLPMLYVVPATATAGFLRLQISNDCSIEPPAQASRTGNGLANLTARVEAAGGHLASALAGCWFNVVAEIPAAPVAAPGAVADRPASL